MEFDIRNFKERLVRCVNNEPESFPGWYKADLLTVGKTYTCIDVDVHSWHTLVTLREFPDEQFNSCMFEEVE